MQNKFKKIFLFILIIIAFIVVVFSFRSIAQYQKERQKTLVAESLTEMYRLHPMDSTTVNNYVKNLLLTDQNNTAYTVISNYFATAPKADYQHNVPLWLDRAQASLATNRCTEAIADGWYADELSWPPTTHNSEVAEDIMHQALNMPDCINDGS